MSPAYFKVEYAGDILLIKATISKKQLTNGVNISNIQI